MPTDLPRDTAPATVDHNSIIATLNKVVRESLAEEGLTPEIVDYVMLDVVCSPVIAFKGQREADAVEAIPTMGGDYIVRHRGGDEHVSADSLKVMRARYLIALNPNDPPEAVEGTKATQQEER